MSGLDHVKIDRFQFDWSKGMHGNVRVRAGIPKAELIKPPAGPEHNWTHYRYPVDVEISVSPTGRSVQVWINGKRVHP